MTSELNANAADFQHIVDTANGLYALLLDIETELSYFQPAALKGMGLDVILEKVKYGIAKYEGRNA